METEDREKSSIKNKDVLLYGEKTDAYSFIIVLDGSAYRPMYEYMFADLCRCKNVTFVIDIKNNKGLKNILMRDKVRNHLNGKLDFMAIEKNNLYDAINVEMGKTDNVVVVFLNAALYFNSYLVGSIQYYKRKWPSLKMVLFYLDVVGTGVSKNADYLRENRLFDLVYTVDEGDAKRINAIKWKTCYSADLELATNKATMDLYFCGALKDRGAIIEQCAKLADSNNVLARIDIVCDKNSQNMKKLLGVNVYNFGEFISYPKVLGRQLNAKCMLEIAPQGQAALTLRPYEAVVYNRKLLTNNRSIFDFSYYDERFMRYFEVPDDIDWDWVKEDIAVDYGYKGEFSSVYLLENIVMRLEQQR